MIQLYESIQINTKGIDLYEFSEIVINWVDNEGITNGLLNISILHTSASILLQENADSDVLEDLKDFYKKIVPFNSNYLHNAEGKDDMPAHIKTSLTNTNITVSIIEKKIITGFWQGFYLFEHRLENKTRNIQLHFIGD
ncbi:secondary thiamine-phosphate synthase enzyme YjbQ [Alphaproteobacteria bacterium]|nr:secondary thiamine-phosphate synthase enzyme YjbQ [Alphaproteobacteria bacterium]